MKYSFVVNTVISLNLDVEADSLEEAVEIAQAAPVMSLCYQCARGTEDEWSTGGELDGDPTGCELVQLIIDDVDADLTLARKLWNE